MRPVHVAIALLAIAVSCSSSEHSSAHPAPRDTAASSGLPARADTAAPRNAAGLETTPSGTSGIDASPRVAEHVVPSKTLGPFTVDGAAYVVEMDRYKGEGDTGVSRVVVKDAAGHLLYEENLSALRDPDPESYVEATAYVLEDARRRARGLVLSYEELPSAPGVPADTRLLALRDGKLQVLTTWLDTDKLPDGTQPGSKQLLAGDLLPELHRLDGFYATIVFHVDMSCAPGGERCVTLAPADSIGNLRRLIVHETPTTIDEPVSVPIFARPDSTLKPTWITPKAGSKVTVLDGAARVRIVEADAENAGRRTLKISDPWLYIRVNDTTGWVYGEETFQKIGILQAG